MRARQLTDLVGEPRTDRPRRLRDEVPHVGHLGPRVLGDLIRIRFEGATGRATKTGADLVLHDAARVDGPVAEIGQDAAHVVDVDPEFTLRVPMHGVDDGLTPAADGRRTSWSTLPASCAWTGPDGS